MTIAEQVTQLKIDFDEVKLAGYTQGQEEGYWEGYDDGLNEGYYNGYEEGQHHPDTSTLERTLGHEDNYYRYMDALEATYNTLQVDVSLAGGTVDENDTLQQTIKIAKETYEDKGYNEGYTAGLISGDTSAAYNQGVIDGKQAEYDAFWDRFQLNDRVMNNGGVYPYSFCYWDMTNFRPKVDIHLAPGFSDCTMMFAHTNVYSFEDKRYQPYSLVELLNKYGVKLRTTGYKNFLQMFYGSMVTEVPSIDISSATVIGNMFYNCGKLTTIEELIVSETTPVLNCFTGCVNLENITIKGVIGKSGAGFPSTKLSRTSITSIINALSPKVTGKITFSKTAVQNAFANATQDFNALIATKPSWTIALQQ